MAAEEEGFWVADQGAATGCDTGVSTRARGPDGAMGKAPLVAMPGSTRTTVGSLSIIDACRLRSTERSASEASPASAKRRSGSRSTQRRNHSSKPAGSSPGSSPCSMTRSPGGSMGCTAISIRSALRLTPSPSTERQ